MWGVPSAESVVQDVRYGLRQLRRTPLFTVATVTTLGLTIGATSALFAIANAVILRPLAFPQSDRIVSISIAQQGTDTRVMDEPTARLAMVSALPSFESLAMYFTTGANFVGGSEPERVAGARVSLRFFDVVRVRPALGRSFAPDEMRTGGAPVIILSDSLAARAFGRTADALNRPVTLDDQRYTVIGIMPAGITLPAKRDFWLPLDPRTRWSPGGGGFLYTQFIGRLRDGASPLAGRDDLMALRRAGAPALPAQVRQSDIRVMPLHERLYGNFRAPIALLLGAVVSVLLIGCANVANLLLARGAVRRQELALRTALGASRARLMRQLLVESVLLALLGAVPGLLLVIYALRAFLRFGPVELTRIPGITTDARVLLFLVGVTIGIGLLFGVGPAIAAGRADPHEPLQGAGRSRDTHASRPRRVLVMLELAAAVVVMIGAALLAKSLVRFHAVDRGFRADSVLTASMTLPRPRYGDPAARRAFFDGVLERVRALPVVESAALPGGLNSLAMTMAWPEGSKTGPDSQSSPIGITYVGSSNFRTFGIPIRSGRECGDGGAVDAQAAVVNERMARRAFPGGGAVGRQINLGSEGTFTVIGVSADVHDLRSNAMPLPEVFICTREDSTFADIALRARAGTDPSALASALREAVRAVDPAQPVAEVTTVRQLVDESVSSRRFDTLLFGGFAVLAFVLAIFGLYAVTAYLVSQRTHEFGVRIALGAGRGRVLRLVLRQGLVPAVSGIGLGLLASVALTRLLRSMLFEVDTLDASVFAAVSVSLVLVSALATAIPARRAVRVDPVVALRCE